MRTFSAYIQWHPKSKLHVQLAPGILRAHTQWATLVLLAISLTCWACSGKNGGGDLQEAADLHSDIGDAFRDNSASGEVAMDVVQEGVRQPESGTLDQAADQMPEVDALDATSPPGTAGRCDMCYIQADCAEGTVCSELLPGNFCLSECQDGEDCPKGWVCDHARLDGPMCVPEEGSCGVACLTTGQCTLGDTCNQESGACEPALEVCAECEHDWQCGPSYRCHLERKVCLPQCDSDADCGPTASCHPATGPFVHMCLPNPGSECCFGPPCDGTCPVDKPLSDPVSGVCVQCLGDGDCTGFNIICLGGTCLPVECSYCQEPYPACVPVNELWSCMECDADNDCEIGHYCDASDYVCKLPTDLSLGACSYLTSCNIGGIAFDLKCETEQGLCYDKHGFCDGVYARCQSGSTCIPLNQLGVDPAMAIPPLPSGGTLSTVGFCECSEPVTFGEWTVCLLPGAEPCQVSPGCLGSYCIQPETIDMYWWVVPSDAPAGICIDLTDYIIIN